VEYARTTEAAQREIVVTRKMHSGINKTNVRCSSFPDNNFADIYTYTYSYTYSYTRCDKGFSYRRLITPSNTNGLTNDSNIYVLTFMCSFFLEGFLPK